MYNDHSQNQYDIIQFSAIFLKQKNNFLCAFLKFVRGNLIPMNKKIFTMIIAAKDFDSSFCVFRGGIWKYQVYANLDRFRGQSHPRCKRKHIIKTN